MSIENVKLAMIAAVGPNLELGRNGDLVWHISADLKRFKQLTTGHPVIMGRKTWESLPKRPLPGRRNIVLSHNARDLDGAIVVSSVEDALKACDGEAFPFVMGGAEIYRTMLPVADALYITKIDADPGEDVDLWFPEYEREWHLAEATDWLLDPKGVKYRFEIWLKNAN